MIVVDRITNFYKKALLAEDIVKNILTTATQPPSMV
jgi:hypothetical protein